MIKKTFDITMRVPNGIVTKSITVVQLNSKYWIDLQSVMTALNSGWKKWSLYFRGCADKHGLLRHDDPYQVGATLLLVSPLALPGLLVDLDALPELQEYWTMRNRIAGMRQVWHDAWMTSKFDHVGDLTISRKVSAATVRDLHKYLKTGDTMASSAAKLGVATKTASRLKSGNYPMDRDTSMAWVQTFGGGRASV